MKRYLCVLLSMLMACVFVACSKSNEADNKITKIYYISTDKNSIVPVKINYDGDTTKAMLEEALDALGTDPGNVEYTKTMPSEVKIREYQLVDGNLTIYLNTEYATLDSYTEILVRAAIVKTLTQIDGIESIEFFVGNAPLTSYKGEAVGPMTRDTFIDDFGDEEDSMQRATLNLYFATGEGTRLAAEKREVHYSGNVSIEKEIVDQLMSGPKNSSLLRTINSDTKLISVAVQGSTCFVNFDNSIETGITGITETATVFSIVNSLCSLDNIESVVILVKGSTPSMFTVNADLSGPLSFNDFIVTRLDESLSPYIEEEFF